jgi:outer membrane lipoprotein SlyB
MRRDNMSYTKYSGMLVAAAAVGLAGCASPPYSQNAGYPNSNPSYPNVPYPNAQYPSSPDNRDVRYGYVESVEVVPAEQRAAGPGIGAIGGAIAGGVLGNQVGHGTGRAAATVGGAIAGGVIGNQVEQHVRGPNQATTTYRFRVRLDDGSYQTYTQDQHDNLRVGDRVRVDNGRVWRS